MNKYTIIGVIVLMSISLLGVVGLQLYWISDAIRVKQSQFNHSVNEALVRAVEKLETQEAIAVVANKMEALQQAPVPDSVAAVKPVTPTKQPVATKNLPPTKSPKTKPAAVTTSLTPTTELFWIEGAPVVPDKIIAGRNGKTWLQLANGDTVPYKQLKANNHTIRYIEADKNLNLSAGTKVQVYTDVKEAVKLIRKMPAEQHLRILDSAQTYFRHQNRSFSFSVDTLRLLASRLDSLHHTTRFTTTARPTDYTSVEVRNDSVFLFKKGTSRAVYFNQVKKPAARAFSINGSAATLKPGTIAAMAPSESATREFKRTIAEQANTPEIKPVATSAGNATTQSQTKRAPEKRTATEKLELKKEKLNDVVQKMVVEYVAKDEPLEQRLNLQHLQHLLTSELQKQGIELPFGYWVVSGNKDTIEAKNVVAYTDTSIPKYKASLFPNDIIAKSDYLDLYFPDSKSYALKSLWGMLALSGFLTLVIIATFGTTIHIIYKQKKLSEMKNDFINNMTHEFKTPIATISLAADAIANPKVYQHPDRLKQYANIISQENKRMNTQVENVLQIALLEKNEFRMKLEPVDVHLLIAKAIESIRLQVEQRLGQIHVQLDALKHELRSDEVHLYNVICNLLDNANKYSPASPEIKLTTQNVEGGILIAVDDKGLGMSKETQQRVFEKFYRVPTGNLHNVKGFGLGLSYVKAIVQAHHGNIRLWSEPGKGSRFEIFLPFSNS